MKLQGHKIKGIEKAECCAESKIAYNYAFRYKDIIKRIYGAKVAEFVRSDAVSELLNLVTSDIKSNEKVAKRYNVDLIIHIFRNGIKKYSEQKYSILTSYKEIGNIFKPLDGVEI